MAYNESIVLRIREALSGIKKVKEIKMFGGLAFMVNGKMCVTVRNDRIMCRINPELHDDTIKKKGCTTVFMRGKEYKGFVYVEHEDIKSKKDFNYWINLALDFNNQAKSTIKKKLV